MKKLLLIDVEGCFIKRNHLKVENQFADLLLQMADKFELVLKEECTKDCVKYTKQHLKVEKDTNYDRKLE